MPMTPIPPFPALSDRANGTYNGKAFDWASHMANTFVTEVNALVANLNSIAAGGAYAIPLIVKTQSAIGGTAGALAANADAASMLAATVIFVDAVDSRGASFRDMITGLFNNVTSSVKGAIRIVKVGDSSKWISYQVLSWSPNTTYGQLAVVYAGGSSANPFAVDDAVVVHFQRTGDKGDTGAAAIYPHMQVSEQYASGTQGPATGTGTIDRALNTVLYNTITGASLSSGSILLPAGTYEFRGVSVVAGNSSTCNKAILHNVTDNAPFIVGTSQRGGSNENTVSVVSGRFTISAAKTFKLRTHVGLVASTFGLPGEGGYPETFALAEFWKLA